jgi:hypothetical protein
MTKTVLYLSGYQKSQENSSHITRISLLQNIVVPEVSNKKKKNCSISLEVYKRKLVPEAKKFKQYE